MKIKNIYLQYFLICFKMGAICFGGGYAMIPMMEREFLQKRKYCSEAELSDIFALAQSLPGLISLNTVILLGFKRKGFWLASAGGVGLIIPSMVSMCLVALAYAQIIANPYVESVFVGVRAFVVALLIVAVIRMYKNAVVDAFTFLLMLFASAMLVLSDVFEWGWFNPIYSIILSAFLGIIYQTYFKKRDRL